MTNATKRLRVGMVGCGHISRWQGPAWLDSPHADLVAVCDVDAGRAQARAQAWGVAQVYSDAREMIEREQLDALDIVTRPETHAALVRLAAERGAHLLCQKPLAATLAEATAMVDLCERAGVRFMVNEMMRFMPWYADMAALIRDGAVGRVHYMRYIAPRAAYQALHPSYGPQMYMMQMPRLLIYEALIHWIDVARVFAGEIETVYARAARINPDIAGEDVALVVLGHAGGATTALDQSWAAPGGPPPPDGEGGTVVEGNAGVLYYTPARRELTLTNLSETRLIGSYPPWDAYYYQAFRACIGHFAEAVATEQPFASSARDNLRTLGATLAAYDSLATGQAVRL